MLNYSEQDRWLEIEFYFLLKKTLSENNNSAFVYTLLDSICVLYNINTTIIKALLNTIVRDQSVLKPTKAELCILWYKQERSVRGLYKYTNIHPNTFRKYVEQNNLVEEIYIPRLRKNQIEEVRKFMKATNKLAEMWG